MASDKEFVEYVAEQVAEAGDIRYRMMFGEYALYCNDKVTALICDNRLYVKPTDGGRSFIGEPVEGEPYPGAKPCFVITDKLDDREWMSELIRLTSEALPVPKPKKITKK